MASIQSFEKGLKQPPYYAMPDSIWLDAADMSSGFLDIIEENCF